MDFINKFEFNTDILPVPDIREKKKISEKLTKELNEKDSFRYLDELLDKEYMDKYFNEK
jgi:hypothetical protein